MRPAHSSGVVDEVLVGQHGLHQPDPLGLGGIDDPARQHEIGRPSRTDQARGRRCVPPPPGMMPTRTSGWPKWADAAAIRTVHACISSHPPAPRLSVDRGHDDLGHRLEPSHDPCQLPGIPLDRLTPAQPHQVFEVGVGDEVALDPAGEHDHAQRRRRRSVAEHDFELGHGRHAHEVARRPA